MKVPFLQRFFNSRASPTNDFFSGFLYACGMSGSGKAVNERTAMQTTAVNACVRILSETVASLPLHTYNYTDTGKEKAYKHSLYYLLHDSPNPEMTSFVFRETLMSHLLLWGNAYTYIVRDGRGSVIELWPLLPDRMRVGRLGDSGEIYYCYQTSSGELNLRADEVMHIPALGFDGLIGYSPISMAKEAIGLSLSTEEFGAKFFANGANPGGVLEHPGVVKDPARIRDSWNAVYQGSNNAHKVAVLEEGMSYKPIGIPPDAAQFLETRRFQVTEICRMFRVPAHMVGDLERSTFSNIENQSLEFVIYTIRPWLIRLEQAMAKSLLLPNERGVYFPKFAVEGLLRGDFKTRMEGYAVARQNGWMSVNNIRELEDMNLIPTADGGDDMHANGNFVKLSQIGLWTQKYDGNNSMKGGTGNE